LLVPAALQAKPLPIDAAG